MPAQTNAPKAKEYPTPYQRACFARSGCSAPIFCAVMGATAAEKADVLGLSKSYDRMFRHIFTPILERYGVPEHDRTYLMVFYIHGLMAIVAEWLKADCADSVEDMAAMMQKCVMQYGKQP